MISTEVTTLLNNQIQKEMYSAYLYLDFSNYYETQGLFGFSNWYYVQAQEEMDHAILIRTYLLNNDKIVKLLSINAPDAKINGTGDPLDLSLEHEKYVTGLINAIYESAADDKDYRTMEFLNWFIKEQGEEEKNVSDMITKYNLFGSDTKSLYQMDQELAARVYAPPSLVL